MAAWHQPGFVATIIGPDNKPIREYSNEHGQRTVRIPFGSEYKILLKNKTALRAYASVEIDGTKALDEGRRIVLQPGQSLEVERFVSSLTKGKKFKFVEAGHSDVQDPTSSENGRIRVTFEPEAVVTRGYSDWYERTFPLTAASVVNHQVLTNNVTTYTANTGFATPPTCASVSAAMGQPSKSPARSDAGATVEGGNSSQAFFISNDTFQTSTGIHIDIWMKGPFVEAPTAVKPFVCYPLFGAGAPSLFYNGHVMQGVTSVTTEGGALILRIDPAFVELKI